ncbi:MAG: sigma-70 family RNA polymerase sigma factor [Oscillospiraceae bacterium]|nr:sigma-70 family RNA polymerase sigma factor [Oscillospiraceae bacterium]
MNERAVLRSLKAGDTGALGEIIGFYTPYLYTIASNIMDPPMSREDVEETVSDTFVRLWEHRAEVTPGKLKPWLAAVVRNCAKDVLRNHRFSEPLDDDVLKIAVPDGMEQSVLRAELTEIAREAVDALGEPDSEIFKRHYFLYQKTEEIAAGLHMNAATVRTRLRRGRERLREYFCERGYSCADPNL